MRNLIFLLLSPISIFSYAQDSIIENKQDTATTKPLDKIKKEWSVDFSGFIQADVIIDNKKAVYIDGYYPSYLESNKVDYNSYITMRQTQLGLGITNNSTGIRGFVQIDFIGPDNKTQPRLRKIFITYKNWKIGQDWSTVDDLNTWPNILDFNGPNAAAFGRRMMIQYSKQINERNSFQVALEDPAIPSVSLPEDGLWKSKSLYPNLVGTYKYGSHSYVRAAGIISPITYQERRTAEDDFKTNTTIGYGINLTSNIYTDQLSNFKFGAFAGNGVSTRVVAFSGDGYDGIVDSKTNNSLKKLPVLSLLGAYEYWWNKKWSSVLFYSFSTVGKKEYMDGDSSKNLKSVQHGGFNTMYQPTSYFKTGMDFTYGFVDRYDGKRSEQARLQLSAVFMF